MTGENQKKEHTSGPTLGRVGCYVLFNKSFMGTFPRGKAQFAFVFSAMKSLQVLRFGCVWFIVLTEG